MNEIVKAKLTEIYKISLMRWRETNLHSESVHYSEIGHLVQEVMHELAKEEEAN